MKRSSLEGSKVLRILKRETEELNGKPLEEVKVTDKVVCVVATPHGYKTMIIKGV